MQKHLEQSFTDAFDRYADELFRHASFRLSDRDKAQELVQETFMRSWNSARGGTEIKDMRAFLYRTLRHLIIDEYRRKKPASLDAMLEEESASDAVMADEHDEMAEAMDRLDGARALALLSELPPAYCEVLTLRFVDGLTPQEIGARLDENENTASVRIHRALKALRKIAERAP
ncbi:MAG TPA: RNA polymerase sigma factor [Candidatus Paceibacterota bacterium]